MKITLIHPFHYFGLNRFAHRLMPLQGITLTYLARLLPHGHEVRLVYEARETIDYTEPTDLVAITTLTVTAKRAYRIADRFRSRGVKVILGGPHVSAVPAEAKQHADAVAIGNGETTLPAIVKDVEDGTLKPFYHNFVPDCLPPLENVSAPNRWCTSIAASRGCEMNCEFCSMQSIFGKFYLQRDPGEVVREIRKVTSPNIFFVDDNFFGTSRKTRTYYTDILKAVAKTGKNWYGQCRLPIVEDEATVDVFARTNCNALLIGFESLNPENGRQIAKQVVNRDYYLSVVRKLHTRGIGVVGSFIFGFDNDTCDTITQTLAFCIESKLELAFFTVLTPFPGTALFKRLDREGRIINRNWDDYTMDQCVFQPQHFSPEELTTCVSLAEKKFFSLKSIFKRSQFGMNYGYLEKFLAVNVLRNMGLKFTSDICNSLKHCE
ncbi:MAG: B12-binding domain-containing radical SAM protein [Desulfobacterales bacterium]|nr:B12-binding domain-containing radical SAM protein [Desulfobacterales bacterium]